MEEQGQAFLIIRDILPGVDEKWFIRAWMKSEMRKALDYASPKWAGMPADELVFWLLKFELDGNYKKGERWRGDFVPQWTGLIYALYQWKYCVRSSELIDKLPLEQMEQFYFPLHEASEDNAVEKIHTWLK